MQSDSPLRPKSLVLYKNRPALILRVGRKKIEIETSGGEVLSVRHKDVTLLHPGSLESLAELRPVEGEIETARELLAGESTTLAELAELAFGEYTPATAWSSWLVVEDGLYFSGQPESIVAHTAELVLQIKSDREAKAARERAWSEFIQRLESGSYLPEDEQLLAGVVSLALGQREGSQVMDALDRKTTPENAHALLLEIGYWDQSVNVYPARAGLATDDPDVPVGALPQEDRRDLTHLVSLAIDDEGSRDPDDAISLDGDRIWVHIADVAALVPNGSAADAVARSRGANLYLPEGTVTMLPRQITDQLGLGLDETSPALSFGMDLDEEGIITKLEIVPSWVKVKRFTYQEAEEALRNEPLRSLYQIASNHQARRVANGSIEIDLPEVKVRVVDGQVEVSPLVPLRSRDLVREFMLMTGEAVGRYALETGVTIPFTSQEGPAEEVEPARSPSEMFALRRLMKPSQQVLSPGPHAGLGLELYVQATSPLRRYLDLVVHQQLRAHLRGEPGLDDQELLEAIGSAGAVSGSVRWAERRSNEHWTLVYLLQNPGWVGEGIIVDKRGRRDLVLIPELALETNLYLQRKLPLDSQMQLTFQEADLPNLETYFRESS